MQLVCLVMEWYYVGSLKRTRLESSYIVSRWSFVFARKSLKDVLRSLKEVLKTSSGRRLDNVLNKGRRDFHFRLI